MARLTWDDVGGRFYESGVQKCVLYPYSNNAYGNGIAWSGITGISENPSGGEATRLFADDTKYLNLYSAEEFAATIEAYTYPDEFAACDGSAEIATGLTIGQQTRQTFGLCYRTGVGTDTDSDKGYKLHFIYGAKASPSAKSYSTINDSPEAITFSWEVTTTPVNVSGAKPTANAVINSVEVNDPVKMAKIECYIYGAPETPFNAAATYKVGDIVKKDTATYICDTAITTPHAWSQDEWTEVQAANIGPKLPTPDELKALLA